jgi:hypothetical protein
MRAGVVVRANVGNSPKLKPCDEPTDRGQPSGWLALFRTFSHLRFLNFLKAHAMFHKTRQICEMNPGTFTMVAPNLNHG